MSSSSCRGTKKSIYRKDVGGEVIKGTEMGVYYRTKTKRRKKFSEVQNGDKQMEMKKNLEKKPGIVCRTNASRKEYDAPSFEED